MNASSPAAFAVIFLLLSGCASLPPPVASTDETGFREVRNQPHYRVKVREDATSLPAGARFHLPVADIGTLGPNPDVTEAQTRLVATQAARSVCVALSPWVQWVDDEAGQAGRIVLELRRIGASSSGLAMASAVIGVVVPGPFRLPAGLGSLEIDSRIETEDGVPLLELHWARGANPLLNRARASSIGDAWELAPSFARDLETALEALHPTRQPDAMRKVNLDACHSRFGEVSVAGRAASLLLPLSPEALDPAEDPDAKP